MNDKYYRDIFGGKKYSDYTFNFQNDSLNKILTYYNFIITEESDEQKAKRLAQEKAEKRNNKIDQILGE